MREDARQSIITALRFEFDSPYITPARAVEIMNTTKELDRNDFLEMQSDLISEGIINE